MTGMKNQRRKILIKPRLQLKIVFMFLLVSVLAVGMQSILMSRSLGDAGFAQDDSGRMFSLLRENFMVTLAALLPATIMIGAITTFRVVGPIFRFERFLEAIERGEYPPDCELRSGDDLQELCRILNRVSRPWRTSKEGEEGGVHVVRIETDVEEAASLTPDVSVAEEASPRSSLEQG